MNVSLDLPPVHSVTIRHNFETAHRLPALGGKCTSLHGHSWWTSITVEGPLTPEGTVVEFGSLKHQLRAWIDAMLDHGTMLGYLDPLIAPLQDAGCKVYVFGDPDPSRAAEALSAGLVWPTVENVAALLQRVTAMVLGGSYPDARVVRVDVQETHVNAAGWLA